MGLGGGLQRNVHMPFLVNDIDMWRFPKDLDSGQRTRRQMIQRMMQIEEQNKEIYG